MLTGLAALLGGVIFKRLNLSTPMLTGSIVVVSIYTLLIPGLSFFPSTLNVAVQICSGAVIGSSMTTCEIREMPQIVLPAAVLILCLTTFNLACAYAMHATGVTDIPTSVFASAPGGMAEMTLLSPDFGANPIYVSIIQFSRLLFVNAAFPTMIKYIERKKLYPVRLLNVKSSSTLRLNKADRCILPPANPVKNLFITLVFAAIGGLLFKWLRIPAGTILGAAIFVALRNATVSEHIYMPKQVKYAVQLGIGCYVGVQMTRECLYIIRSILPPIVILLTASIIYTYVCALLIYKHSGFDFTTCLLMCAPGGLNQMSIIADDMQADSPKVALMHSLRLIGTVAFSHNLIHIMVLIPL